MDPLGFGKIIADKWDILMMFPAAFLAVLGFGFVLGLAITRAFLNDRLTIQQMRIVDLEKVLEGKLSPGFLFPTRKRSKQMSFGLILIFVGLGAALLGAIIVSFDKSVPPQQAKLEPPGAPQKIEKLNPTAPIPAPPSPDSQRQELLKRRGQMELAVRDAEGTPIRCEFMDGQGSQLKITAGDVGYSIGVSIAGATGAWVYNTGPSVKKMYVVKSAERGKPVDMRLLRLSRQSDALSIGERAFFELNDGKILQLLLVGTLYYRDGDDRDEARFKYKIYDAGSFLIDAL